MALIPESHIRRVQTEECNHETLSGLDDLSPAVLLKGFRRHPLHSPFPKMEAAVGTLTWIGMGEA